VDTAKPRCQAHQRFLEFVVYAASEPSSEPACQCSMSSFAADDRFPVEWMRAGFSQARKTVPIWTPSAPKASAALMPRASAMPPAAMSASVSMHSFRRLNESIDGNHLSNEPAPDQTIGATGALSSLPDSPR
jgi:hypothetical protein